MRQEQVLNRNLISHRLYQPLIDNMESKIMFEDVAHFYTGARCQLMGEECISRITAVHEDGTIECNYNDIGTTEHAPSDVFPILRKISDITDDEKRERMKNAKWVLPINGNCDLHTRYINPSDIPWFFKQGFDLFRLIESGQAIDKSTLKQPL